MEPITREETYLTAIAEGKQVQISPITREEMYLAKLAGQDITLPDPITRKEMFLEAAIEGGSGGGSGGGTGWDGTLFKDSSRPVSIGENMFYGDDTLKTVNIKKCSGIGQNAFAGCNNLQSVEIRGEDENTGFSVSSGAFSGCASLKNVALGYITYLGSDVFHSCKSLEKVTIESTRTGSITINPNAFYGCVNLKEISGSGSPIKCGGVNMQAFDGCKNLEKIDFSKCSHIGSYAFLNCEKLIAVILRDSAVCNVDLSAFTGTPVEMGQGYIYVPTYMFEHYRSAYETPLNELIPGFFDILFRKIEDYPEICG